MCMCRLESRSMIFQCTFFVVFINTKCGYDDDDMQRRKKWDLLHEQMKRRISNDINQCASVSRAENER